MKTRLQKEELSHRLSKDEFQAMLDLEEKGIVGYKLHRNDAITELTLMLKPLISAQSGTMGDELSQAKMGKYLEATKTAQECIKILKPLAKEHEIATRERYSKRKQTKKQTNPQVGEKVIKKSAPIEKVVKAEVLKAEDITTEVLKAEDITTAVILDAQAESNKDEDYLSKLG